MTRPLRIVVVEDYDALREAICEVLGLVMAETRRTNSPSSAISTSST